MKLYTNKKKDRSPYADLSYKRLDAINGTKPEVKTQKKVFENDGRVRGKK